MPEQGSLFQPPPQLELELFSRGLTIAERANEGRWAREQSKWKAEVPHVGSREGQVDNIDFVSAEGLLRDPALLPFQALSAQLSATMTPVNTREQGS